MSLNDSAAKTRQFGDSICTCKICYHKIASDCMKSNCNCCTNSNHSMVLDGIEGFTRAPER
ncbi:MAG: hypothetical protein ACJ71K_02580 [Nitrososphaeraceae archaeon]